MGKIDDMRRLREEQYAADQAKARAPKAKAAAVEPAAPSRPARPPAPKKIPTPHASSTTDDKGRCPECGKMKPLNNGVLANHQKGFGKACAGSRKKPV